MDRRCSQFLSIKYVTCKLLSLKEVAPEFPCIEGQLHACGLRRCNQSIAQRTEEQRPGPSPDSFDNLPDQKEPRCRCMGVTNHQGVQRRMSFAMGLVHDRIYHRGRAGGVEPWRRHRATCFERDGVVDTCSCSTLSLNRGIYTLNRHQVEMLK